MGLAIVGIFMSEVAAPAFAEMKRGRATVERIVPMTDGEIILNVKVKVARNGAIKKDKNVKRLLKRGYTFVPTSIAVC